MAVTAFLVQEPQQQLLVADEPARAAGGVVAWAGRRVAPPAPAVWGIAGGSIKDERNDLYVTAHGQGLG